MEATESRQNDGPVLAKAARQQVKVVFKRNVTSEQIHKSLDRIFKEGGCPTCGLGGLDVRLIPEEIFRPEQRTEIFQQLDGVKHATVTPF